MMFPKPEPRKKTKARKRRQKTKREKPVRPYVFAREMDICRCCGVRPAESRHELIFKSQGGKVTKENCVAVCGNGVAACHGYLQRHEIQVEREPNAEETLVFMVTTKAAQQWLNTVAANQHRRFLRVGDQWPSSVRNRFAGGFTIDSEVVR